MSVLEDAPQFNAGRGAVFTHDGRNELDASIMDGASGKVTAGTLDDPEVDDLLDDLGEQVLRTGGEVVMVPTERMATGTGAGAGTPHPGNPLIGGRPDAAREAARNPRGPGPP